jgi:hypothetical protein
VRKIRWVSWKRRGWMLIGACAKVGCGMVTWGCIQALLRRGEGAVIYIYIYELFRLYSGAINALLYTLFIYMREVSIRQPTWGYKMFRAAMWSCAFSRVLSWAYWGSIKALWRRY